MKLLLVNDKGQTVACFEGIEGYNAQNSSNVFALLDFLETLIATAKGNKEQRSSEVSSFATIPAAGLPLARESNVVNRLTGPTLTPSRADPRNRVFLRTRPR